MPIVARARHKAIMVVFSALCFVGCSDDGGPPDADLGPASVELGTGTVDFVSVTNGESLELVSGIQGGFHFVVHARIQGLIPGNPANAGLPENPRTQFAAYAGLDGEQLDLVLPPYRLGYLSDGGGVYSLPSGRILQLDDQYVPAVYGTEVRITVRVEDTVGRTVSDERTILVISDQQPDAGPDDAGPLDAPAADGS